MANETRRETRAGQRLGRFFIALLLVLLPAVTVLAQPVERWVLKNGLTVLLQRTPDLPLVNVTMMMGVGSSAEHPGITGIAHYVEHMNFRATQNISQADVTGFIDRIGGRWSGYTSLEQTLYAATVPAWALESLLRTEAERMSRARFDPDAFERERFSVIAEAQGYENDPMLILWDLALATSFELHPYRYNIIGWHTDLLSIQRDPAYDFYRSYYGPNNAVLVITGDVEPARVRRLVEDLFGAAEAAPRSGRVAVTEPLQKGEKTAQLVHPGSAQNLLLVYRAPAVTQPEYAALLVLDAVLAGGRGFVSLPGPAPAQAGSLLQGVVETSGGWQASTALTPTRAPYVFALGASVPVDTNLDKVQAGIESLLDSLQRDGVSARQLEAAVYRIRTANRLEDRTLADRAHRLAYFELLDSWDLLETLDQAIEQVASQQIQAFIKDWMQPHQRTVARHRIGQILAPQKSEAPGQIPAAGDPPQPSPVPARALDPLPDRDIAREDLTLSNGAWLSAARSREGVAALRLRLGWGSRLDPPGQEGIAVVAAQLLTASTELETWLQDSGAEWNNSADSPTLLSNREYVDFSFLLPASKLDGLLTQIRQALTGPWPEAWVDRVRQRVEYQITESEDDAEWQAQRAALQGLGGELSFPNRSGVANLTTNQVLRFVETQLRGGNVWAALVAPEAPKALLNRLSSMLGSLPGGGSPKPNTDPTQTPSPAPDIRNRTIFLAGKTQAHVMAALPAPGCASDDYLPLRLLNVVLGESGYAGRLGDALVDTGLAYSVYANLPCGRNPQPMTISTATATHHLAETLQRLRATFSRLHEAGATESELEFAKAFVLGRMVLDLERQEVLAQRLVESGYLGEDLLDFERRSQKILGVPLTRVNEVASQWCRPGMVSLGAAGAVARQP